MFHRIIFLLLILGSLFCNFNRCTVCFQSFSEHRLQSTQNAARMKRFKDYTSIKAWNTKNIIVSLLCWSLTLLCSFKHSLQLALQKWEPAGRICDFGNFFNGLAKSPNACFDRPEYWMSAICVAKLWNTPSLRGLYDKNSTS